MESNPLQSAGKLWIGQNKMPQIILAPDQPQGGGGKWFCSLFYRHGLLTPLEFLGFMRAHAAAVFTHGDFIHWYTKNGEALANTALSMQMDWKKAANMGVVQAKHIYRTRGLNAAIHHYMKFCERIDRDYGKIAGTEPFDPSFYQWRVTRKVQGTLKLLLTPLVWGQAFRFLKNNTISRSEWVRA